MIRMELNPTDSSASNDSDRTRRTFLRTAGAAALTAASYSRVMGANDKVNVAVIGLGGRGRNHMDFYTDIPDCRIAAVCDVNQEALERGQAQVLKKAGEQPKGYGDMKDVFADKNVDAVSMPLPNHWHALATIWACQAGKDVYIEKPACYNVFEGQQMIAAARKYKRMVQIGSQSRSIPHKIRAMQLLADGAIGPVHTAKGLCYKRRKSIGHVADLDQPPAGVDWDKFLGPAPMRKFNELRFKYNWHWFWDTGNGDIGNQGVHEMDIARWGLGVGLPKSVVSTGGKYAYDDDQETPNTQFASFDYGGKQIQFEVRGLYTGGEGDLERRGGNFVADLFYGTDGWMAVDSAGFQVYKGEKSEKTMDEKNAGGKDTVPHMQNFIDACKSRNYKDLHADVEIAVPSADLCHLANVSYRLGRMLKFDPAARHFVGDSEANKMLTRNYRKPYVVPEKV
jgi:predicted dehydrogenase